MTKLIFDFLFSLLPLGVLIFLMTKKRPVSSFTSLSIAAVMLYITRLLYFQDTAGLLHAGIVQGFLSAWTPILIIWGAVFLFQTLENSYALHTIREWLNHISQQKIAQVMIIGWAFIFFIEGASGFGTPTALAAPLLVGLGFKPIQTIVFCLLMDTIPVSFGAVGTPTWFGFSTLGLSPDAILAIGQNTALLHLCASFFIPVWALRFLFSWKEIRTHWIFISLSILSCVIPSFFLAQVSTEFPSLIGGAIGLLVTVLLARYHIGIPTEKKNQKFHISYSQLFRSFFPLGAVVILLLITRLNFLPFKAFLKDPTPIVSLGNLSMSASGVVQWKSIFGTGLSWVHELLYVPSILPFFLVCIISFWVLDMPKMFIRKVFTVSFERLKKPVLSLIATLILVKLFLVGDPSPAFIVGQTISGVLGTAWIGFAPFLGALGAFFSGSNTVSNLTFGGVHMSVAQSLHVPPSIPLALQNVGGAAGNMISLSNIIAGCSVLGLINQEGRILSKTFWPLVVYCGVAGILGFFLL